jgi:hypothetical protein
MKSNGMPQHKRMAMATRTVGLKHGGRVKAFAEGGEVRARNTATNERMLRDRMAADKRNESPRKSLPVRMVNPKSGEMDPEETSRINTNSFLSEIGMDDRIDRKARGGKVKKGH